MANEIDWMKFYPAKFMDAEDVSMMCDEAIGLYMRILCYSWKHDSIPKDHKSIMKIFKLSKHKFNKLWPELEKSFYEKDERFFQKRLTKVLNEAKNNFQQKSESGSKGAEKRWHPHRSANTGANNENMLDLDQDLEEESNIAQSLCESDNRAGTGPEKINKKKSKVDAMTGLAISKAINGYSKALTLDVPETAPIVKKCLYAVLKVRQVGLDADHLLAAILQTRRRQGLTSPVAFCIKLIKDPDFAVADGCLADAKKIIRSWRDDENPGLKAMSPDMGC